MIDQSDANPDDERIPGISPVFDEAAGAFRAEELDEESLSMLVEEVTSPDGTGTVTVPIEGGPEALVRGLDRPMLELIGNEIDVLQPPFLHFSDFQDDLEKAIRCTGRIQLDTQSGGAYLGTGFFVTHNLLLTNRHIAIEFIKGLTFLNVKDILPNGKKGRMSMRTHVSGDGSDLTEIIAVRLVHPYWDLAVLEVDRDEGSEHLRLMDKQPDNLEGREVAVIGYPGPVTYEEMNLPIEIKMQLVRLQKQLLGDRFGRKHLQPGTLIGLEDRSQSDFPTVHALTHDCNTQPGNSGSLVWDVEAGRVIGIHYFGSLTRKRNYAVPAWELALDPHLRNLGLFDAAEPQMALAQDATGPDWLRHWTGFADSFDVPLA
jgi:V8-like Glu-specific endopeptidase